VNAARLLQHFDRISEAPDAVPRLRRFVLDLAVRGKLIEQDPQDEPAAELLKRIQSEKVRLVKEGKIRSPRALEASEEGSEPFQIPVAWTWCRLSDVGAIIGGGTPPSADADNFTSGGSGTAWLTPADLGKHTSLYVSHGARDLTSQGLRSSSATLMPRGSVLFTSRAPIGYTAIAANAVSTNQGFKSVVPFIPACNLYIAVYFRAFGQWIDGKASGTTFREVSGKIVASLPFPLPPLAEQHRIVAKVDELMALCDRLEAARTERERRRDRLAAASLHCLNNGEDAESFHERASFHLRYLPLLTTRPEHIQQLRQTILNFAVRGQLVPQDPNDEPAAELLERIKMKKALLIKDGALRKEKPLPPVVKDEAPFPIPTTWSWARIGTCSLLTEYGTSAKSDHVENGIPVLKMGDVRDGKLHLGGQKKIPRSIEDLPQLFLKRFDLLYNRTNSAELVGKTGIYLGDDDVYTFASYLIRIRFLIDLASPIYANLAMNAPYFRKTQILPELQQQCGQANVNGTKLRNMVIPVPPLAEQRRIVAKVDELMSLCNRLEVQVRDGQVIQRHLTDAVLHVAVERATATHMERELPPTLPC
jgi:type I restriction enzyme S subunit